jgi:hypothetical protein
LNQKAIKKHKIREMKMKKVLLLVVATFALNALPVVYADEPLPEIAPVDEPTIEPLPAMVPAQ